MSLLGKTTQIRQRAVEEESHIIVLNLSGYDDPKNLENRLIKLQKDLLQNEGRKRLSLHIKADITCKSQEELDRLDQNLFQVVSAKCIKVQDWYVFFDRFAIFEIEIGNTFREYIIRHSAFIKLFHEMNQFDYKISKITENKIQVDLLRPHGFDFVGTMLCLIKPPQGRFENIKTTEIKPQSFQKTVQYSDKDKLEAILNAFLYPGKELKNASFTQLINFIGLLNHNFSVFTNIYEFTNKCLIEANRGSSSSLIIRQTCCDLIVSVLHRESWSTIVQMRNNQIKTSNVIDGQGDCLEALNSESFKKYKAIQDEEMNNFLSLFFGEVAENTPGTLKMIYQDPSTVPQDIKGFWNTFFVECLPGATKLTPKKMLDYELFKTNDFCRELSEALGLRHVKGLEIDGDITEALKKNVESFKEEGYVITKDNYIKILKIVQRSLIRIPVIICGDTGCGKTRIVDFIASCLLEDEFKCFTLHAGVTEEQFVTRLAKYFEEARSLQTSEKRNNLLKCKKMWILIDEFNTSTLQEHFVELMKDRTSTLSDRLQDVPDNVVFIGCCNPYMIMEQGSVTNQEDIGYIAESSTTNLSHKVFPISDSLLSYLLDFGQLKSEVEKNLARDMIKNKRCGHSSSELNCVKTNPDDVEKLILAIIVNC